MSPLVVGRHALERAACARAENTGHGIRRVCALVACPAALLHLTNPSPAPSATATATTTAYAAAAAAFVAKRVHLHGAHQTREQSRRGFVSRPTALAANSAAHLSDFTLLVDFLIYN